VVRLALWAMVVCVSFFLVLAQAVGSTLVAQVGGVAGFLVSLSECFLAGFHFFFFQIFDTRSTHVRRFLLDTRPSSEFFVAVRSYC